MSIADESSQDTSPTHISLETSETAAVGATPLTISPAGEQNTSSLLMSLREDFHAKTSASQEINSALKEGRSRDSGEKCYESFARYDLMSSSWRTSQLCLDGTLAEFSETWPRAGWMQSGNVYQREPLVPLTSVIESSWLPTPTHSDYRGGRSKEAGESCGRGPNNNYRDYCRQILGLIVPCPRYTEWAMGYPDQWTRLKDLETPSSRKSQSGSAEEL
jgi:hypothetical protein